MKQCLILSHQIKQDTKEMSMHTFFFAFRPVCNILESCSTQTIAFLDEFWTSWEHNSIKELCRNCICLDETGSTNLQWVMKALYVLIKHELKQSELNTEATSLMTRKECDASAPSPVTHKWTAICNKFKELLLSKKKVTIRVLFLGQEGIRWK